MPTNNFKVKNQCDIFNLGFKYDQDEATLHLQRKLKYELDNLVI